MAKRELELLATQNGYKAMHSTILSTNLQYCVTSIVSEVARFVSHIKMLTLNKLLGHHYIMLSFELTRAFYVAIVCSS